MKGVGVVMARTINPQLFGADEMPRASGEPDQQMNPKKWRHIEIQLDTINKNNEKVALWMQSAENKMEQLYLNQKQVCENLRVLSEQFTQQQVIFQSKFNERRNAEDRTQDLIDRHQMLVQNFESRLSQLQKVASEQEFKLKSYQATYDEILREIRNIKRYEARS